MEDLATYKARRYDEYVSMCKILSIPPVTYEVFTVNLYNRVRRILDFKTQNY